MGKKKTRKKCNVESGSRVGYVFGRVIGQCKNCYHFGGYDNYKKRMKYSKGGMCQCSKDMDITHAHGKPEFGCWNWKPRKSRKTIGIKIKT